MPPSRHRLLRDEPLSPVAGVAVTIAAVALPTAAVYPLKQVAPVVSLGVVYLLAVLLVATYAGFRLGALAAVLSAAGFNWFHLPPVHRWHISESENWVALAAFGIVAAIASSVADVARSRAREAEWRRREADLVAHLAPLLLGAGERRASLAAAGELIGGSAGTGAATLEVPPTGRTVEGVQPFELRDGGALIGRLLVPGSLDADVELRLRHRVVPAVAALVAVMLQRDAIATEAVETPQHHGK